MRSLVLVATALLLLSSILPFSPASTMPARAVDISLPCGDVDGDGTVTISDIFKVAGKFSKFKPLDWDKKGDLDGDGVITIRDIFIVASQFGRRCSTLPFETIAHGQFSGIGSHPPELRVARNQDEWETLWAEHAGSAELPPVDFEREMVVGLFDAHTSGGYELTFDQLILEKNEVVVRATHTASCFGITIFTEPHHIVRVERTDFPLRLALTQVFVDC